MKTLTYLVKDIPALRSYLESPNIFANKNSKSVLVQVFSSLTDREMLGRISDEIIKYIPKAVIVGSTSVGEIIHGQLQVGTTVLSFSFFDDTVLKPIAVPTPAGAEFEAGQNLMREITGIEEVAGVLVLATPLSINVAKLFSGMSEESFDFPVFGGGAGVYDPNLVSMIFLGRQFISAGAVAIAYLSKELHIYTSTFLGWKPLSKEMTITETNGMLLKKIDGECAFDVYSRYLDIPNDKNFFDNALEFPILVQRSDKTIARVPFFADKDGCIGFLADIEPGEKFHIGYGDPDLILNNTASVQRELYDFEPDSIFLYACICRRFLLQNAVNFETQPFEHIAPTTGFYTYGEFIRCDNNILLLNSTIVVVGLREGKRGQCYRLTPSTAVKDPPSSISNDPFSNKHNRIITRLLHFISVVTSELEDANRDLKRVSALDKLTQINNRLKLDEILHDELCRSARYGTDLSVLMLDIDNFKTVNDNFGHLVGDIVLMELARILKNNVRECDTVGRWGGEEFLIILPQTCLANSLAVAEKIRVTVEKAEFPEAKHITCSIGAASFREGDDQDKLLFRSDMALYEAKNAGRNKVKQEKAEWSTSR